MSSITTYNDAAPADDGTKVNANKVTYASIVTNLTDPIKDFIEANLPIRNVSNAAPTATDDSADGYEVGSNWVDTAAGAVYLCTDETPGAAVWENISAPFASGTRMLFQQETAPTGWTIDTTLNDAMLRLVDGSSQTFETVASPGGTDDFTTAFSASKATAGYSLQVADVPALSVSIPTRVVAVTPTATDNSRLGRGDTSAATGAAQVVSTTGGGGSHSHDITLDPVFADIIIAVKD